MHSTLVTFGCSWTYGVGAYYTDNDVTNLEKDTTPPSSGPGKFWDLSEIEPYAFRTLLSRKFNLENINYSEGGASNDYNFYTFETIMGDKNRREQFLSSTPIVLWGITSTARIFRNDVEDNRYKNFHLRDSNSMFFLNEDYHPDMNDTELLQFIKELSTNKRRLYLSLHAGLYYDHNEEVTIIANKMKIINDVLSFYNVPIIWFDTFNTHAYYNSPDHYIPTDLLSTMLNNEKINFKSRYHLSSWTNDDQRISKSVKRGLLNPKSFHPSKLGHEKITDILTPYIEQLI
jgi:hypothetical protein